MSLGSCQAELSSIITEMESIYAGIASNCSGIGEENCLSALNSVISKYRGMLNLLYSVDTNRLADWFMEMMGMDEEE